MTRRFGSWWIAPLLALLAAAVPANALAQQAQEAPDALVQRLAAEVLDAAKASNGDVDVAALVDAKIMPNVDFARMTASAMARAWRDATPEQQQRLQVEFKALLVRTYAGALAQARDRTVVVKPLRAAPGDDALVRTLVKGQGEPLQVDYRLVRETAGWKIVDLNVMGVWLVEAYRGQFAAEIGARGIDGLIATLTARNRTVVAGSR
ncbi:MAG: phospholipid-binding protein MlaC [Rhizobacter sp.]